MDQCIEMNSKPCPDFQQSEEIKKASRKSVDNCIYSDQQIAKRNDKEAFDEAVRRFC